MFKLKQKVTHPIHGRGFVVEVDEARKLVTIFAFARQGYVSVHPTSLTPYVEDATVEVPTTTQEETW